MNTKVLSVGGSIIAPNAPDSTFLADFCKMASAWLSEQNDRRLILVAGGGAPARVYQNAYKALLETLNAQEKERLAFKTEAHYNAACDWIGIRATRLNAELLKASFGPLCTADVVTDPTCAPTTFAGSVLVAAGWKPGFSTDNDAVLLAETYGAKTVVNLSNIEKVYTDDPRTNPNATPIDHISWADFRKMVGDEWVPGKNCPFDPIASKKAAQLGLTVICAAGKNIHNIRAILDEKPFVGTRISG